MLGPQQQTEISPEEFEQQVKAWLDASGSGLVDFRVDHRRMLAGAAGEYELDVVASFEALGGAKFVVLIECKRLVRPVEREVVLALSAKGQEVGAHKLMIFATAGFQSGAIEYATKHGIALVAVVEGRFLFRTRGQDERLLTHEEALEIGLPRFAGWWIADKPDGTSYIQIGARGELGPLISWLQEG